MYMHDIIESDPKYFILCDRSLRYVFKRKLLYCQLNASA